MEAGPHLVPPPLRMPIPLCHGEKSEQWIEPCLSLGRWVFSANVCLKCRPPPPPPNTETAQCFSAISPIAIYLDFFFPLTCTSASIKDISKKGVLEVALSSMCPKFSAFTVQSLKRPLIYVSRFYAHWLACCAVRPGRRCSATG